MPIQYTQPGPALEADWRRHGIYRATRQAEMPAMTTGWPALDRLLPGGGYPIGAVTELLIERPGIGEVSLLLRALCQPADTRCAAPRRLALIAPPALFNSAALIQLGIDCEHTPIVQCRDDAERVWSVEQMASAGGFTAFVLWGDSLDMTALRRLQLAGEKARCPVFVYRDLKRAAERSPAALRLAVTARRVNDGLCQRLEVLKCRGPAGARIDGLTIDADRPWRLPIEPSPDSTAVTTVNEPARNDMATDERRDVARPAFPPLGSR